MSEESGGWGEKGVRKGAPSGEREKGKNPLREEFLLRDDATTHMRSTLFDKRTALFCFRKLLLVFRS